MVEHGKGGKIRVHGGEETHIDGGKMASAPHLLNMDSQ